MRLHSRLLGAMLLTAIALTLGAGTANANRSLEVEGSRTELTLNGVVTFASSAARVICPTTLVKTISRVIPKVLRTGMGRITDVRTNRPEGNCFADEGVTLRAIIVLVGERENGRLWGLFYEGFLGSLPTPTGYLIRIENTQVQFELSIAGVAVRCLYEGPVGGLARVEAGGAIERLTTLPNTARRVSGSVFCPASGEFRANLDPLQRIRIVLH